MRPWDQLLRHYATFLKVKGSYIWAAYLEDPVSIELMLAIPDQEWSKPEPPSLFGWCAVLDRLTDVGDQLIASRARGEGVRFYPRPKLPAVELRKQRNKAGLDNAIEAARRGGGTARCGET